jgi:tryptophan 2,3-dioxygenase
MADEEMDQAQDLAKRGLISDAAMVKLKKKKAASQGQIQVAAKKESAADEMRRLLASPVPVLKPQSPASSAKQMKKLLREPSEES